MSSTNDDDDASSFNQWGDRHSTSPDAHGTEAYKASHHSSPFKHCVSAGRLWIHPLFHAVASIFTNQLIVDNVKHGAAVSLRKSSEHHLNLPSPHPKNHSQPIYHHSSILPRGRVFLVFVEGVEPRYVIIFQEKIELSIIFTTPSQLPCCRPPRVNPSALPPKH